VSVARKGGELEARFEGPHKGCSLVLPGIRSAEAISGGSARPEDGGIRIAVDDNAAMVKATVS
jgi:hypothetical protein